MPRARSKLSLVVPTPEEIAATRKAMWEAWIDECVGIQEAFIEGLLAVLPSLKDAE